MMRVRWLPLAAQSRIRTWFYRAPFYLPLITAVLLILASKHAWTRPYDGLRVTSPLFKVDRINGPAIKAGFQVGDIILALDGTPVQKVGAFYRGKTPGDQVTFTVLREGIPLQLVLTLERPSPYILFRRFQAIIAGLAFWLFSIIPFALKASSGEMRLLFLLSQCGVIVLGAESLSALLVDWGSRLFNSSLCLISPLIVHLHTTFPQIKTFFHKRLLLRLAYGLGLTLSLPFVLPDHHFARLPFLYNLGQLYFTFAVLVAMASLIHTYITTPHERRCIQPMTLGIALAFLPMVISSFFPKALQGHFPLLYNFALIPLSYAYAISIHKPVQIDFILNRGLIYFTISLVWAILYLSSVTILDRLFPSAAVGRPLMGAAITLVMAAFFAPFKERVQALVDRAFYGGGYDYPRVIGHVSKALAQALDITQLIEILVEWTSDTMHLEGATLLLPDDQGRLTARGSKGLDQDPALRVRLKADGPLIQALQRLARPVETSGLHQALNDSKLPPEERTLLEESEVQLWLPLLSKGKLQGVLLLGDKYGGNPFNAEDYRILDTLARQAGIACENVQLVEKLRRKLREVTALKEALEESHRRQTMVREEERKKLAREIHDVALQKLSEVIIELKECRQVAQNSLREKLDDIQKEVQFLLDEFRHICAGLRPPTLDILGLASAIRFHTSENEWPFAVALDLMDDQGKQIPEEVAINLFRIYQEALANVKKHARARYVKVKLVISPQEVMLSVKDDGCGFVVPKRIDSLVQRGCFGLMSVNERAQMLGGKLSLTSRPGQGTTLKVQVPLPCEEGRGHLTRRQDFHLAQDDAFLSRPHHSKTGE